MGARGESRDEVVIDDALNEDIPVVVVSRDLVEAGVVSCC